MPVGSKNIASGYNAFRIAASNIGSSQIQSWHLSGSIVGSAMLSNSAVSSQHIADDAISTQHLAGGAVDSAALGALAVSSQHLALSAVTSGAISDGAVQPYHLNVVVAQHLGQPAASATDAVYSQDSAWSASSINSSVAVGTQLDFPRNLQYLLTPNTGSAGLYSGGTIVVVGSDVLGNSISESVAVTDLNSGSDPIVGTVVFAKASTVSFSNVTIHTDSSSASNDMSVHVGDGNILGLGNSVLGTDAVPFAWIGTARQDGSFTVQTGGVGTAGIAFENALNAASAVVCSVILSK
jgi:hypothetical protein